MNLEHEVIFITGANRGLGLSFAKAAINRGAKKVYAAARDPSAIALPNVVPVRIDVTGECQRSCRVKQVTRRSASSLG